LRNQTAVGATSGGARARAALRARLDSLQITRRRGALGLPEAVALGAAAVLLVLAVFSYLFLLVPQRSRLQSLETERNDLQRLLKSEETMIGGRKDTQQRVGEILASLNDFEVEHLGQPSSVNNVIAELNRLILRNGLRISGGISYTQLQETAPGEQKNQPQRRAGGEQGEARVVQSIFPGIGITLTVEGTYANLRRFIRDIEADRQFVVVNTVELEGVSDSGAGLAPGAAAPESAPMNPTSPASPTSPMSRTSPRGAPAPAMPVNPEGGPPPGAQASAPPAAPARGALVSLRLDMAAYFRRAAAASE
jgi:Tfp pilus assembly protein PilO